MQHKPISLAIVGLGMASKPHLAALRQLSATDTHIAISGIYTRNTDRKRKVAKQWGLSTYDSVQQIADDPIVDGVILITPPNARLHLVRVLASAGKHILMEKPVERTLANARHIVALCEDNNISLGMVLQHRFRRGAIAMSDLIHSGRLGAIGLVRVNIPWWREQSYYDAEGRGTYAVDGGGVLITQAIHVLDVMLSLTGKVKTVCAMTGTTVLHRMETEDFATVGLVFESGALGSVVATTAAYPGGAEVIQIDAENGSAQLRAGELVIHTHDGITETIGEVTGTGGGADPMDFPCDWHRHVIADFVHSIRTNTAPKITGRAALQVHQLLDAIQKSAASGKAVTVGDI